MADYSSFYYPTDKDLERKALDKLKRNAQGYEFESHNKLYCIRCGVVVGNTTIHDSVCAPNEVQLNAQLELLKMEGKHGTKVF